MAEKSLQDATLDRDTKEKLDAELRYRHIAKFVQPNSFILDLGARYGYGYEYLLAKDTSITSVDLNANTLAKIPSHPKVRVVVSSIEKFIQENLKKSNWDVAILAEVIEHIPLWKWHKFLDDVFKIAGKIIITTPYMQGQVNYIRGNKEKYVDASEALEPDTHKVFNITPELFKELGFNVVNVEVIKHPTPRFPKENFLRYGLRHLILQGQKWHNKYWLLELRQQY